MSQPTLTSSVAPDNVIEPVNGFFAAGKSRTAAQLAASVRTNSASGRERISAASKKASKRQRAVALGPTPERLAKGDVAAPRSAGGFYRSLTMAEQLRDGRERGLQKPLSRLSPDQLCQLREKKKLDHDARTSEGMFQAAEKLRRHYEGLSIGARAQDLNRIAAGTDDADPEGEEAWVHNYKIFRIACRLMGWHDGAPHRGAGRITVAIVCEGLTIREAASQHLPTGRIETMQVTALDRLREGLFALAMHWKMV